MPERKGSFDVFGGAQLNGVSFISLQIGCASDLSITLLKEGDKVVGLVKKSISVSAH